MNSIFKATLGAAALAMAIPFPPASAQDKTGSGWKGEGELGFLRTSGNTDSQSFAAKLGLGYDYAQWRHAGKLEATTKDDQGETTAERYYAAGKSDYKFNEHSYLYGAVDYEEDHFSGYEYRANESIGAGYRVIDQQQMTLDLEAGPGARQSKLDTGENENEATLRLGANFGWNISPTATFTEEISSAIGEESTTSRSLTALSTKINAVFAMKLSYLYKHTTNVPVGFDSTDSELAATLVYSF